MLVLVFLLSLSVSENTEMVQLGISKKRRKIKFLQILNPDYRDYRAE